MKKTLFFVVASLCAGWLTAEEENYKLSLLKNNGQHLYYERNFPWPRKIKLTPAAVKGARDLDKLATISREYQTIDKPDNCEGCEILPKYSLTEKEIKEIGKNFESLENYIAKYDKDYPTKRNNLHDLQPFPSREECLAHKKYLASNFQAFKAQYLASHPEKKEFFASLNQEELDKYLAFHWQNLQANIHAFETGA